MRIANIALWHGKSMNLLPIFRVITGEHDDRRRREDHVPIGATAKGQPKFSAPLDQIREGIVFAIVKDSSHVLDAHLRDWLRLGKERANKEGKKEGKGQEKEVGSCLFVGNPALFCNPRIAGWEEVLRRNRVR